MKIILIPYSTCGLDSYYCYMVNIAWVLDHCMLHKLGQCHKYVCSQNTCALMTSRLNHQYISSNCVDLVCTKYGDTHTTMGLHPLVQGDNNPSFYHTIVMVLSYWHVFLDMQQFHIMYLMWFDIKLMCQVDENGLHNVSFGSKCSLPPSMFVA